MNEYLLGSFLRDKESMIIEYKEFCLKDNIYQLFDRTEIGRMIYEASFPSELNDIMMYNIYKYLDIYLPKYSCAFHNSNHQDDMLFVIGVDDEGEVTGIPYRGDLTRHQDALRTHAEKLMRTELSDACCLSIDLRIKRCEVCVDLLDDTAIRTQLRFQNLQRMYTQLIRRRYVKRRKQWNADIMRYKGKLQSVFDNRAFRAEFELFLKERGLYARFEKVLSNEHYVIDLDKVKDYKNNRDTLIWWLIQFKDLKVEECMRQKPTPPVLSKQCNAEACSLTQLTHLRRRWIDRNPLLNYYVLEIRIRTVKKDCQRAIAFIDPRKRHWRRVTRYLEDNQPHSTDI